MNRRHLFFIQSLVDEREEFEESVYSNIYFKILYYFVILLFSFSYFVILFGKLSENINIYILISKYHLIGKIPFINMLNEEEFL